MGVVSISLCEQGLALCRAFKEADGRFYIEFEYASVTSADIDPKGLLRAVGDATIIGRRTRVVAVPHPGFNTTDRCMKQNMLEDVLDSYLTAGTVVRVRLIDRVEACEVITQRPLQEEATQIVTGGMLALRADAETYGTPLNDARYKLLTEYMREEAGKFLQDPAKCANAAEAFAAYEAVRSQPGAFLYTPDAFWNAMTEAQHSVSTGYKRPRGVGSFFYSDAYWGYEDWCLEKDEQQRQGEEEREEEREVEEGLHDVKLEEASDADIAALRLAANVSADGQMVPVKLEGAFNAAIETGIEGSTISTARQVVKVEGITVEEDDKQQLQLLVLAQQREACKRKRQRRAA